MVKYLIFSFLAALALPTLAAEDVFLETDLEPQEVHVNAQTVYRLRVYQSVDVRDLRITGPSARLADLRAIGDGRVFETQRDGKQYRVHERSYAVFPFASGTVELSGAQASGQALSPKAKSASGLQSFRLVAPSRRLTVLPIDVQADSVPWLPANTVTLSETWAADGNAQRRTIRIEAHGVDAAQLPALRFAVDGMSIHAEPPQLANRFAGEQNVATREQTFVMTPTRAGQIFVPSLQLPWWQVELDSPAIASLPGRLLDYAGAPAQIDPVAPALPASVVYIAATSALLLIAALTAWVRRGALQAAWRLRRACRERNVHAVRDGLLQWAARTWPQSPPMTLAALGERLRDPGARRALAAIERALYGPAGAEYSSEALLDTVLAVKRDGAG